MYKRIIDISGLVHKKSLFLLGPRQTGKSTLLRHLFPQAKYYDLLQADVFRDLSAHPETIRQQLTSQDKLVIVDEIQKLPAILDEVHSMMERNKELRFILTGSSARKLKRGGANLLGGRAWNVSLYPLVSKEVGLDRTLDRLSKGSIPSILDSPDAYEDLKAYVGNYLREEIQAEGLTRSIENFSRFLTVAGLCNGQLVNFTSVANDSGVPPRTIHEYFQIIVDTLIGFMLEPYQKTKKRKPVATSKFYFFDIGVANCLNQRKEVLPGTNSYGDALEHLVFLELRAYLDYTRKDVPLTFWRSQSRIEVDFVVGDSIAIEVKSTNRTSRRHTKGLLSLAEELKLERKIVICNENQKRKTDEGVEVFPIQDFLDDLWNHEIIK